MELTHCVSTCYTSPCISNTISIPPPFDWAWTSRPGRDVPARQSELHRSSGTEIPIWSGRSDDFCSVPFRHVTRVADARTIRSPSSPRSEKPVTPTPLAATLMEFPVSVANKRLTADLTPLDATLTKNRG